MPKDKAPSDDFTKEFSTKNRGVVHKYIIVVVQTGCLIPVINITIVTLILKLKLQQRLRLQTNSLLHHLIQNYNQGTNQN